ncbi:hypothetical protein ACOMHN_014786 [Nucella lapillus]
MLYSLAFKITLKPVTSKGEVVGGGGSERVLLGWVASAEGRRGGGEGEALLQGWRYCTVTPLHSRLHHRYSRVVNPLPWHSRLHHRRRRMVNPAMPLDSRPCSLASITTAAGRSTHCPGTVAFITAAAGWSTQRCPWTLALIIDIAAVS